MANGLGVFCGYMVRRWIGISRWRRFAGRVWTRIRPEIKTGREPSPDQPVVLQQTYRAALVAQRKGDLRLALLLAHQCDCLASEEQLPGLQALLTELRSESLVDG